MNALHQLGQLIQSVEDSRGWTLREISRRIERAGHSMTHSHVGNLKRKPIRSVTQDTIQALAVGLDLPERMVGEAALESMGVHDVNPAEAGAAVAIARDPSLSERDRRVLLAVVREMHSEDKQPIQDQTDGSAATGMPVARDAQPDGITARGEEAAPNPRRPWEDDEYALAAKRGRNRGREARRRQDDAAEDGGA